jgi:hypothetical protein
MTILWFKQHILSDKCCGSAINLLREFAKQKRLDAEFYRARYFLYLKWSHFMIGLKYEPGCMSKSPATFIPFLSDNTHSTSGNFVNVDCKKTGLIPLEFHYGAEIAANRVVVSVRPYKSTVAQKSDQFFARKRFDCFFELTLFIEYFNRLTNNLYMDQCVERNDDE